LRNPLNALQGWVDLAEADGDPEHFERCRRAIDRMDVLIEDLLTLARAGEQIAELEAVEIRTVAERCWGTVSTREASLAVESEQTIRADASRLQQLLENLMRNAVEHGGHDVTVTVGDLPDGFYVEDSGPGISSDIRDEVFKGGYSTTEDGTGFGLAIVSEIADAHGWTVDLTDGTDGGARFEFTGVNRDR
jgi:signal transduction histidine kinase